MDRLGLRACRGATSSTRQPRRLAPGGEGAQRLPGGLRCGRACGTMAPQRLGRLSGPVVATLPLLAPKTRLPCHNAGKRARHCGRILAGSGCHNANQSHSSLRRSGTRSIGEKHESMHDLIMTKTELPGSSINPTNRSHRIQSTRSRSFCDPPNHSPSYELYCTTPGPKDAASGSSLWNPSSQCKSHQQKLPLPGLVALRFYRPLPSRSGACRCN